MEILKNFIVFEGLDGAGTSTQTTLLSKEIKNSYKTNEPTDSKIGRIIREALKKNLILKPESLTFLFIADRYEHVFSHNGIYERCQRGEIVISDRYLFSTIAYQGLNLPIDYLIQLNEKFPLPHILFFLNTSLEICEQRIIQRGKMKELYEEKNLQKRILDNYFKAIEYYKNFGLKIYLLDGNLPIEKLLEEELKILKENKII